VAYDPRDGSTYSAINNPVFGAEVQHSRDLGKTWQQSKKNPKFPEGGKLSVNRIWHIEPSHEGEPGVIYAGAEPASLFRSADRGETWDEVTGLTSHPSRDKWNPGNGGLCLHSIVADTGTKGRMWVGISSVGTFGTTDGGKSWTTHNKGVRADYFPERFPEFGQCVHHMMSPRTSPGTLYQQNHCGVYRSDNGGKEWVDISAGLPSQFGFVLGLHSQDPKTLYVIPEDAVQGKDLGGGQRYLTDAKMRVFRSRDGGANREPLTKGLPQGNAYMHFMREGMATDAYEECGIYAGSTTGQLYYSRNNGDSWELLAEHLPPILSVNTGMVG